MGRISYDNGYYKDETPFAQLEDEYNGDTLTTLLFGAVLGVIALFLLSVCWKCCADNEDQGDCMGVQGSSARESMVVAQEVKPGILVLQGGSQEEQMRIIREYEAIRMQQEHHHQQLALHHSPPPMNYGTTRQLHLQQPRPMPQPGAGATGGYDPFELIDFDPDANVPRPPPYAPNAP